MANHLGVRNIQEMNQHVTNIFFGIPQESNITLEVFRKYQNNGRVATSCCNRSVIFMPDTDSDSLAAFVWSVWIYRGEDGETAPRRGCHRLQVLSRPLQRMWASIHRGVWTDPPGPEDRGDLLWWPWSGEVPLPIANTDRQTHPKVIHGWRFVFISANDVILIFIINNL